MNNKLRYISIISIILIILFLLFKPDSTVPNNDYDLPKLSYEDKEQLINIAYTAVNNFFNNKTKQDFPKKFNNITNKVFIGFRVKGKKRGSYSAKKNNLAESTYIATLRTLKDQRFGAITKEDIPDLKIEILILGNYKPLENNYEPGIHGIRFQKDKKGATYYNTVAIEGNYKTNKLFSKLCKKANLPEDCHKNSSVNKYYFNTIHFATTRFSDNITTFYRSNTLDPKITIKNINQSLNLAIKWLTNNLKEKGIFTYQYNPSNGEYSTKNNMIRQLMSSRFLAELSQTNTNLRELHKKNLDFIFQYWYKEENNTGYIYYNSKSKLGANAMALRTLVYSPFFEEYNPKILANSILKSQNKNGSLEPWHIEPNYTYDKKRLIYFYSGEAILSLIELYEKTKDKTYLDAAIKSQDYYLVEYIENLEENYYPAYVPWHTISLLKLYKITKDKKYIDAIFTLNDELIKMQNTDGKPYPDYLGRFYHPEHPEYGTPHSASDSVYVEGLAYAYEAAKLVNDQERMQKYKEAIILGAHNLINLQFKGSNMYYLQHPERVEGSIRYNVMDNRIRIDTTQHTIDAFRKILEVIEE